MHPFCLPSPPHPLGPKPPSFLSHRSVLFPLFPSFQGWGEGLVRAPGAESYLDPVTSPISRCQSCRLSPAPHLPWLCLPLCGEGVVVWPLSPQAFPACPTANPCPELRV